MVKQLLLLAIFVLVFWPKTVLAMASCEPFGCPQCAAGLHPVILIHGLGGRPEDWHMNDQNYLQLLGDKGYPSNYIREYVYVNADGIDETYDYQGDIRLISADLPKYVEELAALSEFCGGDDSVDLVGYSLGGLVAREYLHQSSINFKDHKIRKLITVGTPHQGVYILWLEKFPEFLPQIGPVVKKKMNDIINSVVWNIKRYQPLDLNSVAIQQIRPDSIYLSNLNNLTMIVQHPDYYTLYGSIDASIRYQIFILKMKIEINLGDLFILPNSAAGIPYSSTNRYPFSDQAIFEVGINGDKDNGFDFAVDWITNNDLKFDHTSLLKYPDIQKTIVDLLTFYK